MPTWTAIRAHYAALLKQSDYTQAEVARRGGLAGQNVISRLLANTRRGPSVETLTRAIAGLGMSTADFFASLEAHRPGPRSLSARVEALEIAIATQPDDDHVRRRHGAAATKREVVLLSPTGETIGTITTLGEGVLDPITPLRAELEQQVVALVRATLDPILDGLTREMDAAVRALRDVDLDAARTLSPGRGSLRRPARPPRPPQVKEMLAEEVS